MEKGFDAWNHLKKTIHGNSSTRVYFHPREIWFAHFGANVGYEQDGRGDEFLRPLLVLRKFNNEVCWALPLTKAQKAGNPYYADFMYYPFPDDRRSAPLQSIAILSQLRLVDAKRLRYKIGTVPEDEFGTIKEKVRRLLA